VLARWLGLAALAAVLPALAGCGGASVTAAETAGSKLTVYSSLPLQGESAAISEQIVGGEKLALAQAGGHVGPFAVSYVSLDDANPTNGQPSPGETAGNAKQAAQDTSTIAYLGDFNSAATAISLPNLNAAGILQVSPASPYIGLTQSLDAGQDEPGRFYLTGKRNFGRLQPGDPVQAAAQVHLMRQLGVRTAFVLDDQNAFEVPLASIVAEAATRGGITVAAHDSIAVEATSVFKGEIEKILASHAQAVFLAAGGGPGTVTLWRELHQADPHLLLLGSSSMANEAFTSQLESAGSVTYLTTPILAESLYPPAGRRVIAQYKRQFGGEAGPYVLYGYEAMSVVLNSIRRARHQGNNRAAVIARFMATRGRDSVLGRYSIEADGETTLSSYGVDRVVGGMPVFYRAIDTAAPLAARR
jgi:branched-chain amino acid transport system substrate-binding protein